MAQQRPGTTYEGHVTYADGSQVSLQCHENRPGECPGVLDNGYLCEGPCPDLDTAPDTAYFVVVVRDPDGSVHALSRRQDGPQGPFTGPWGLLTQQDADGLAKAYNDDPREGGTAEAAEVFRFDNDPVWTEE